MSAKFDSTTQRWRDSVTHLFVKAPEGGGGGGGTPARTTRSAPARQSAPPSSGKSKSKRKGGGGLFGGRGGSLANVAKGAVAPVIVGGLAFVGVRWLTGWALEKTGLAKDQGWMGYLANAVVVVVGFLVLRKFAPKYAWAFLIGGGIAIAVRAIEDGMAHFGSPATGSSSAGVNGITHDDGVHGLTSDRRAA